MTPRSQTAPSTAELVALLRDAALLAEKLQPGTDEDGDRFYGKFAKKFRAAADAVAAAPATHGKQPAKRGLVINECDVDGDGWHHIGRGSRCQCGVFTLAAPRPEGGEARNAVAWAMRDKATGTIVEVSVKPPFDPKFIPADWTREMVPLYSASPAPASRQCQHGKSIDDYCPRCAAGEPFKASPTWEERVRTARNDGKAWKRWSEWMKEANKTVHRNEETYHQLHGEYVEALMRAAFPELAPLEPFHDR